MKYYEWFKNNRKYFSVQLNGFSKPPTKIYKLFLKFIDRDGKIIDLGCGNGMLLKFICKFSGYKLTPYGVDRNICALNQAKENIFPSFSNNFILSDVVNYNFNEGPFEFVITNPIYADWESKNDGRMLKYVSRCYENCIRTLILLCHRDTLIKKGIDSIEDLPELHNFGLKIIKYKNIVFGIKEKL